MANFCPEADIGASKLDLGYLQAFTLLTSTVLLAHFRVLLHAYYLRDFLETRALFTPLERSPWIQNTQDPLCGRKGYKVFKNTLYTHTGFANTTLG